MDAGGLLQAYYALCYSHMAYGVLVWGRSTEWRRIFVAQKRVVRLVFDLGWRESCRETFRRNGLLTLPCIYILKAVVYVKTYLHLFPTTIHAYATRNTNCLKTSAHNTALFEKSPQYDFVKLYNKLPGEIRSINDIKSFKARVKIILINEVFYSHSEYLDFNF